MEILQDTSFNAAFLHGDAGIGKGTLASGLVRELPRHGINMVHISSGDLLREVEIVVNKGDSEHPYVDKLLGIVTKEDIQTMKRRELVRKETVLNMVFIGIAHAANEGADVVLLDAVSRDIPQHIEYLKRLAEMRKRNHITRLDLKLIAPERIVLARLANRNTGRADDGDKKAAVERYFRIKAVNDPMIELLRKQIAAGELDSEYYEIDAMGSKEKVLTDTLGIFLASDRVNLHYRNGSNSQYSVQSSHGLLVPEHPSIIKPH